MTPTIDWEYVRRTTRRTATYLPPWVDRDDVTQEASIAAWRAAERFDETRGTPFEGFLDFRIRGVVRDFARDNQMGRHYRRIAFVPLVPSDAPTVSADVDIDLRDGVTRLLSDLDERTRFFVVEHWMKGRTLREVGADRGVSEARVCQVLSAVRRRLRHHPVWQELAA